MDSVRSEKLTDKEWAKLRNQYDELDRDYQRKRESYGEAFTTVESVNSYIKGLKGVPLNEYDFQYGEAGRQYVNKILREQLD